MLEPSTSSDDDPQYECDLFACPFCGWMWQTEFVEVVAGSPKAQATNVRCPNCLKQFNADLTHEN